MPDTLFDYTPPPSLQPFFLSDARVRFVRGPIGSTKSTAMVMELFRRACEHPPGADGIRRTRFAIVRNTLSQITETCLVTILKCLRPLVQHKVQAQKLILEFNDVHSEWLLLPIDTPQNTNKVLSLELTGAWISEAREIDPAIASDVFSRCGRFSPAGEADGAWYGLIMESNSFSEDSPWYDILEVDLPEKWGYFVQPGGRSPEADWLKYLVPSYYEDLIAANTDAWTESYIDNCITPSLSGEAVFRETFDSKTHAVERLIADPAAPFTIGIDTGRHPAIVIGQTDARGRLLILHSHAEDNMGMELFLNTVVRPILNKRFPGARVFLAIDPAGAQRSQITEESVKMAVERLGFSVVLAPTNKPSTRIRAVERYLSMMVGGGPGLLIDKRYNKELIAAFQRDYRFTRTKDGLREVPEKNHPASDLIDSAQYLCLCVDSGVVARAVDRLTPPEPTTPAFSSAAWT